MAHLAELIREEECLQEGVHVARGTLVLQAHVARVLFGVPAETGGEQKLNKEAS